MTNKQTIHSFHFCTHRWYSNEVTGETLWEKPAVLAWVKVFPYTGDDTTSSSSSAAAEYEEDEDEGDGHLAFREEALHNEEL